MPTESQSAELVANPGCYATSVILALAPLAQVWSCRSQPRDYFRFEVRRIGRGQRTDVENTFCFGGRQSVGVFGVQSPAHGRDRRTARAGARQELIFTPHLLPIPRGILSTIYVQLNREMTPLEVESCFRNFYLGQTVGANIPHAEASAGAVFAATRNYCDLGFCLAEDGRRLVLISCIDNLLKGAAGQAAQNMNLMYGWGEEEGLQ